VKRIKIDNSIIGPSPIIILAKIKYWGFSIFYGISEIFGAIVIQVVCWGTASAVCRKEERDKFFPAFAIMSQLGGLTGSYVLYRIPFSALNNDEFKQILIKILMIVILFISLIAAIYYFIETNVMNSDEYKSRVNKTKGKYVDVRSIIIMDDCLASKGSWMKDQSITELLFNGRHYHVTYILTMQYPLGITPELRGNFDYIFLMKDNFQSNLKRMYDHYAGMFPSFDSFRQVFLQLVENHGAMVVINRSSKGEEDSSFLSQIKYYRAPNIDNVKIGCSQFRKFHEKNYDPNWKNRKHNFDIDQFCMQKKKDKSHLNVEKIEVMGDKKIKPDL
jgi:hypothetical protein